MYSIAGPAEVKGRYQKVRDLLHPVLLVIFIFMPWIRFHGEPFILLDFWNRHFIIFGSVFYAHETPLLFFVVILLVLTIFMVTALFGRLWCGWACPQTVFLNSVYNRVERWILGPYNKRILFYKSEDSFLKKFKILVVYFIFFLISWGLAHSFAAYFLGAASIKNFIQEGPSAHITTFFVCTGITGALFLNFTFFREKLCLYICPYGRFQNALIDRNSLVVAYDPIRGEPRGKISGKLALVNADKGDCVDCRRCVNVCPIKIDIRNGFQFDCISCGQCVDACNDVMKKIGRPQHLIRYETGNQKPITLKLLHLALYGLLIFLFSIGFLWSLYLRTSIDLSISRSHLNPFSVRISSQNDSEQKILQNQIILHIKNQTQKQLQFKLSLSPENEKQGFKMLSPALEVLLDPGQDLKTTAFIEIDENKFLNQNEIIILGSSGQDDLKRTIKFIRPE
jgi:cytochrome c oxidase accessory protein FixG